MLVTAFAFLSMLAGWYYLFYSTAAAGLADLESLRLNRRRVQFRRAGGVVMMALGVSFFSLFQFLKDEPLKPAFFFLAVVVLVLLLLLVILAALDLRLTVKLRRRVGSGYASNKND